jgi:urocanate hydratase
MDEKEKTIEAGTEVAEAPKLPAYRERLKKRYADREFNSDEDWDNAAEEAYAEDEESIKVFQDNNKIIDEVIASDKDLAAIIADIIANHIPFRAAVAKRFSPEDLVAKEGDEDYDYYQKSYEERVATGREIQKIAQERLKNEDEAYDNIDAFCEKKGYSDEEKKEFIGFINEFYNSLSMRKITPEILQTIDNARHYEDDMASAEENGFVAGKNENIAATRAAENSKAAADGVPVPQSAGAPMVDAPEKKKNPIFEGMKKRDYV